MKITRYIKSLALLSLLSLCFISCSGKDSSAKKTEGNATPSAQAQTSNDTEEDFGDWFMAQTDEACVKSVVATSELVEAQFEGKYLYPPINILDGDLDSTWCEADENGSGIGESITIEFEEPVSFDEIQIVNGFASKDYYEKNNRVKSILLTQTASKMEIKDWDSETSKYRVENKNHFQQKVYYLDDGVPDWQSIKFDLTQTAQTITIKIQEVYKGEKYDDTCLDDIRLLYKGNVIPFKNVDELKELQEENSRMMLSEKGGDSFRKQFMDLFKGDDVIYLFGEDDRDLITIYRGDGNDLDFYYGTQDIIETSTKEAFLNDLINSDYGYSFLNEPGNDFGKNTETLPKTKYVLVGIIWHNYRTSYELGNYRILKHESIDYVDTTTAMIVSISGTDTIILNGSPYKVVSHDLVSDWRFDDGW
ncbi:MAG: nicotine adenine dinucleotide glycohydrolase [Treponema sp.]|nr:nicotine adenine dinucleotide glycohydrolase [Treponema sp.]